MAILYQNIKGRQVTAHSYSGGLDWGCPRKYQHKRLNGWVERDERAALGFGKAVESAIQFHHNQNFEPGTGILEFKQLWLREKDNADVTYGEKDGSWEDLYKCGSELLALYEIQRPKLPLEGAVFQQKIVTPLFPGTEYDGLEHLAYLDIVAEPAWDHPLLPKILENGSPTRKVIWDLKTAQNSYFSDPRLASLDRQLREYSWATGISTVGFIVLVKNISAIGTGQWVNILQPTKGLGLGEPYTVLDTEDGYVVVLKSRLQYEEYQSRKALIVGKGAVAAKEALLAEYIFKGVRLPISSVTKTRIQFLPAIISDQARSDAEQLLKREAIEISACNLAGNFPQNPGVRFPHAVCSSCACLGLCLGDDALIKERLIQIDGVF
jgi:hypothetical protein